MAELTVVASLFLGIILLLWFNVLMRRQWKLIAIPVDVLEVFAFICLNLYKYKATVACCQWAVRLDPNPPPVLWINYSNALNQLKQFEQALEKANMAISTVPSSHSKFQQIHLAWLNRGIALQGLERHEEAIAAFKKVIELEPKLWHAWSLMGTSHSSLKYYDKALANFQHLEELQSRFKDSWANLARQADTLSKLKRYDEAYALLEKAKQIQPKEAIVWNDRGLVLVAMGHYEEALSSYNHALELTSQSPINLRPLVLRNRASLFIRAKRYDEALKAIESILQIQSDDLEAWSIRGIALSELGYSDKAMECFEKMTVMQPNHQLGWYNKACEYARRGETTLSLKNLERAMTLNSSWTRDSVNEDSDFDSLREDPRFQQIILAL